MHALPQNKSWYCVCVCQFLPARTDNATSHINIEQQTSDWNHREMLFIDCCVVIHTVMATSTVLFIHHNNPVFTSTFVWHASGIDVSCWYITGALFSQSLAGTVQQLNFAQNKDVEGMQLGEVDFLHHFSYLCNHLFSLKTTRTTKTATSKQVINKPKCALFQKLVMFAIYQKRVHVSTIHSKTFNEFCMGLDQTLCW